MAAGLKAPPGVDEGELMGWTMKSGVDGGKQLSSIEDEEWRMSEGGNPLGFAHDW